MAFWSKNKQPFLSDSLKVLRKGAAMRVIFFYPGEEGTYVDNAEVTLYENGIVHITSNNEESTTHLQNCEILWQFETEAEDRSTKVRLLRSTENPEGPKPPSKPTRGPDKTL
jgi:tRNA G37 N-methylase Trm5